MKKDIEFQSRTAKRRHDNELSHGQHSGDDAAPEVSQIVLVAMADFFDETVKSQSFEQMRAATGRQRGYMSTQVGSAEPADCPYSADEGEE